MTKATCIGTANRGFAQYAQEEIRRLVPSARFVALVPTEIFLCEAEGTTEELLGAIGRQEPMFLRHVQPVDRVWELTRTDDDLHALQRWLAESRTFGQGERVAVQMRKDEKANVPYTPFAVKSALDETLKTVYGAEPVVQQAQRIVSVFACGDKLYAGLSTPAANLSDWSGGAIRFHKEDDQISRAKFKLLEAEQRFALDFGRFRHALDVGAAPGGWTSFLLEKGMKVTAIDPAAMHPSLVRHPQLTIHRKNAAEVKLKSGEFDLLVCDMSWSPRQMGRLVLDLLDALKPGGTAIITVKLMHKKPFQTVRELLETFENRLQLVQAKQLFHNREELTLYLQKLW
uniref:SAM-dependent methyltransferase n=2 Tax=Paenibacillus athensensis TaxID=1967502 RepID=A0A4Y8QBG6_9BACL